MPKEIVPVPAERYFGSIPTYAATTQPILAPKQIFIHQKEI